MGEKSAANLQAGITPFLEPGEQIVATLVAQVRGHSQSMAGGVAGLVGGKRTGTAAREAEAAGVTLAGTMALALTGTRLLIVETGNVGKVRRLLGAYSVSDVGPMEVKRLGLGGSVTLTVLGARVLLESRVGASREFAEVLSRVKAA